MTEITNLDDLIDLRGVIARVEELESDEGADRDELKALSGLLESFKGYGGDEQWRGDWYPITLIRDSYFQDYAQELAEDCDMTNPDLNWPYTCIDWEKASRELQMDYTAAEFDGVTYWAR